jgi:Peptidase family M28
VRQGLPLILAAVLTATAGAASEKIIFNPVSKEVVRQRLEGFKRDNKEREIALLTMFRESGCGGEQLTEQAVKGAKLPNVVCVLPGSGDRTVIVGAHYDHVSEGDGVVDNWSGASLLPSLYEAIRGAPRKHTYIFIGFSAEEDGEVGSHFYAQHMSKEQVAATDAMVNMDTVGLGPTRIWLTHADKRLASAIAYLGKAMGSPVGATDVDQVGSTDSVQFEERKIPSITIHSLDQKAWDANILHSNKDVISAIHEDEYYQTYRLVAAYIAYLDGLSGSKAGQ